MLPPHSVFIFTDGIDKERYVSKEELIETAKKYTNNENLYIKDLEDAVDFVKEKYHNDVIFFVGSLYIYGTVIRRLKKCEMI